MIKDRFGTFFRRRREAMGLTLRDFCESHGFQAGTVSRLERCQASPPKSRDVLGHYANALGLDEWSDDWFRFLALAAVETGRTAPELLSGATLPDDVAEMLGGLRPAGKAETGGAAVMNWTRAIDLDRWADDLDSRAVVPQLVGMLVRPGAGESARRRFPWGEEGQFGGWDGEIDDAIGDQWVPSGRSRWELSTEKRIGQKATEDYDRRTTLTPESERQQTTFVFVTPRRWRPGKDRWVRQKRRRGEWYDVRAYDAQDLEEWLAAAPEVDRWIAGRLGLRPDGVTEIEDYWERIAALSEPPLAPGIFLTSRSDSVEEVRRWLAGPPSVLAFEAGAPDEVVDFFAAYLQACSPEEREGIGARAVVVDTREAWEALAATLRPLVLVPSARLAGEGIDFAGAARTGRHHVLLRARPVAGADQTASRLRRALRHELEEALEGAGLRKTEAERWARECGGFLTVLKRLLAARHGAAQPDWSNAENARELVPILLAGAWDEGDERNPNEADRRALSRLAQRKYEEVRDVARKWAGHIDPPVMRVGSKWGLVSREDSWVLLARHLTGADLQRFAEVATEVLGEADPRWDMPQQERWMAAAHGKTPKHSADLRRSIAETVALLGAMSEGVDTGSVSPQNRATLIVRDLLPKGTAWERWASLSPFLPLFAEAAPGEFLDAVERDLRMADPELTQLFQDSGDALFPSSPHTDLLWALEILAWDREHVAQVAWVLARLAEVDPGGKLGNRPLQTLWAVLCPWNPQTTASVGDRIDVVGAVTSEFPEVGWRLALMLVPQQHETGMYTVRPSWRRWAWVWEPGVLRVDYRQQVEAASDRALDGVGTDVARWEQLLERADDLPPSGLERLLGLAAELDPASWSGTDRQRLAEKLRDVVSRHRRFADATWALPSMAVDRLDVARARFEPDDPVDRHRWLFGQWPELPDAPPGEAMSEREARVGELRRQALAEVMQDGGMAAVLRLAQTTDFAWGVGCVLADAGLPEVDASVLPHLLAADDPRLVWLARGYTWARFRASGWHWVEGLQLAAWSARQDASFATALPFESRTWDLVAALRANEDYWKDVPLGNPDMPIEDLGRAVEMMLAHAHPRKAVEWLVHCAYVRTDVPSETIMNVLEAMLVAPADQTSPTHTWLDLTAHGLQKLFARLQADPLADQGRLQRLEWAYLEALQHGETGPLALHGRLAGDPAFFAQVLGFIRPSDVEQTQTAHLGKEERTRLATRALLLLDKWTAVPGTTGDGTVDPAELMDWVRKARAECEAAGRLGLCDDQIGHVFASAPPERDGSWPCIPVREAIEAVATDALQEGLRAGLFNQRGVFSKSLSEGGEQERALARRYRTHADACAMRWRKTAEALRSLAKEYEEWAEREDRQRDERW